MLNQRPFSYEQSRLGSPRWRSHHKGLGQVGVSIGEQLIPNNPIAQNVYTGRFYGFPGRAYKAVTPAIVTGRQGAYMPTGSYLNKVGMGQTTDPSQYGIVYGGSPSTSTLPIDITGGGGVYQDPSTGGLIFSPSYSTSTQPSTGTPTGVSVPSWLIWAIAGGLLLVVAVKR